MRRLLLASAVVALGACSAFGAGTPSTDDAGTGTGAEAGVEASAESGAEAGADAASATFCPATGAFFCSDFEAKSGGLIDEWLPDTQQPMQLLTLDQAVGHGHVLRTTLDASSAAAGSVILEKDFMRTGAPVTYALDVRVDQTATAQGIELATLRTADAAATVAFHIGIAGGNFYFAEFAKNAAAPGNYMESNLGAADSAWHRFKVKITYTLPLSVEVHKDGSMILSRASILTPASTLLNSMVFGVGANKVGSVAGTLSYLIDNVTLSN